VLCISHLLRSILLLREHGYQHRFDLAVTLFHGFKMFASYFAMFKSRSSTLNLYVLLSFLLVARSVVAAEQAPAEYTDDSAFKKAILNSTNTYRKQHNATSLAWNTTLAEFAENWGESCEFGHSVCRSVYASIVLLCFSSHVEVT